ncbi:MAG: molybdopterin cofactor-binding domain-containing protein [Dehalococcoidia bacterium]
MSEALPRTEEGLTIIGPVGMGFLPEQTGTWLVVRPDGSVTAYAGKVEYGQGIRTGFAMEVADELRVPPGSVEVVLGDTDRVPWDIGTFGSLSTATVGLQLRKAAATARQALLELATNRLDLPVSELICREGRIVSRSDPKRGIGYRELLAGESLIRDVIDDIDLTRADEFVVMARPAQRMDAVARVTGQAVYSQDVAVAGMLFAKLLRPPSFGAKLVDLDTSLAERMPGVAQVVRDGDLVAVLAETDEQAESAAKMLQPRWEEMVDQPSRWDVPDLLLRTAGEAETIQEAGSLEDGFRTADGILEATYYIPYISNAPMEPRAAVAQWENGRLTVWAGTQRPFGIRTELAQYFEIPEDRVRVISPEIGGGFGGKSIYAVAGEAARLAKVAGRPVRVAYSRAEEMTWATFRPAALIEVRSGFKSDGTIVAWEFRAHHAASGPIGVFGRVRSRRGSESPYNVKNAKVTVATSDSPLPAGSYRSLGGAVNHFAREAHIDEIAEAVGMDPLELRLRNLTHPRFRRVLETAAERFGWSSAKPPSKRGVGAAVGLDVGSYAATCVQLEVLASEVKVQRVTAVLDCGLTVNPEGAANQVEGSIIMGMGTALYEAIDFEGGCVLNAGFTRYRVPRINDAPTIDVALVGDPETRSTGAGEPAMVPIAAAIANAVFDMTGQRHRELPIQRHLG